eukprot:jgi/Tetstr1/452211/TSEL_039247.t1
MAVVALALYLRSIVFHTAPEPGPEKGTGRDKETGPTDKARSNDKGDVPADHGSQEGTSKTPARFYNDGPDLDWSPAEIILEQGAPLRFTNPRFAMPDLKLFPAAVGLSISNDNGPAAPAPAFIHTPAPADHQPTEPGVDVDAPTPEPDGSDPNGPERDGQDPGEATGDPERTNRAPVLNGPVRLNNIVAGQAMLIGLGHLLAGTHDPDGDTLKIAGLSASTLEVAGTEGGWLAQSEHGMLGPVTLSYQITDGQAAVWQTAHFDIVRNAFRLSENADLFVGTPYDDDVDAGSGSDIVNAMAGNDLVMGGGGADHIFGDDGDDVLRGDGGDDIIFGGNGDDIIHGGAGHDRLFGEAGNDDLSGGAGHDRLEGGDGDDIMRGGSGDDTVLGGDGADVLDGGEGDDLLLGGQGRDVLKGGTGNDIVSGEDGDDVLAGGEGADQIDAGNGDDSVIGGGGDDNYDGAEGFDTLDYSATTLGLVIDDRTGQASGETIGNDSFSGFEQIKGGEGEDLFVVGAEARVISGGRGRDMFIFEVTDDLPMLSEGVVHDILDFIVGDRIRVRDYEISREASAAERDLFWSIYGDDDDDWLRSDIPALVAHDTLDGIDVTVIRADLDNDDTFDVTINVHNVLLPWAQDPFVA